MIKLNEAQGENGAGESKKEESGTKETTTVKGKTLNPNCVQTSEIQTALNENTDRMEYYGQVYKLTYKNESNEEIIISVVQGDTIARAVIDLKYKNDNYRIASENVRTQNLNDISYPIYDVSNKWTIKNGTVNQNDGYGHDFSLTHYTEVTNFPVFAGTWTIDDTKSTALGKQYLSSCLVDAE